MSVRVVARIRPLLKNELDKDVIVTVDSAEEGRAPNLVKIPSPKNAAEEFTFAFNSVYDQQTSQEELFSAEVAPHLKALFQGLDLTFFAYGVTGTGKTHTMRGGLKLAERGVIPRLLSGVFRRGKKIAKDTNGETTVDVALSYYEIYNDKVFDLLEPPEKRTPAGLPLREKDGKTIVVGLSERSCQDLKDFETLYIEANTNRVTAATKLNAHSSRSHAILRVTVTQTTGDMVLSSTASAIDLAGSEDNRRTDNGKERLVESAAINKSLFVLSQCIDAISRGDKRIPYRESKMTRILSLGQNNGITIMILNLAPMRSYHLDTLSSLNVSSRAKRIEVREIENEVVFKMQPPRTTSNLMSGRQALRPLTNAHNVHTGLAAKEKAAAAAASAGDKPAKAFSVYTDRAKPPARAAITSNTAQPRRSTSTVKRPSDSASGTERPSKLAKPTHTSLSRPQAQPQPETLSISAAQIEAMVERKVSEILASRAAAQPAPPSEPSQTEPSSINDEVARRLEALERRIETSESDSKSEGLRFLLQARQAKERGDDEGALFCYESALPFFPGQAKLLGKIERLTEKLAAKQAGSCAAEPEPTRDAERVRKSKSRKEKRDAGSEHDGSFHGSDADADEESFVDRPRKQSRKQAGRQPAAVSALPDSDGPPTPRTQHLLSIVNSRDVAQIKALHGFGAKKARDLVDFLELKDDYRDLNNDIQTLAQLRMVPGMGGRTVERAYAGLAGV
ncbi:kinesin-domain-containing protein [Coniochaeta ligniaria NRRL 30616]|uniref:Kinesin-domain-containing protein n=1 Tax=Coniochaeta ligniaria NRRL 30616 TaxID=1408157 RepID=A0A1J7JBL8_9PEZI|nr:kinesin-domain-containing protein [Coniochaeta ligniaria NRRL 30616]